MSADDGSCWYFAYGSNMARGTFIERRRMQPSACAAPTSTTIASASICRSGRASAVSRTSSPRRRADLGRRLSSLGAACAFLDRTEGVDRGLYRRLPIEVVADAARGRDGAPQRSRIEASAVIRAGSRRRYLGLLLAGARELALPAEYVAWLESFPLAIDEREALDDRQRVDQGAGRELGGA